MPGILRDTDLFADKSIFFDTGKVSKAVPDKDKIDEVITQQANARRNSEAECAEQSEAGNLNWQHKTADWTCSSCDFYNSDALATHCLNARLDDLTRSTSVSDTSAMSPLSPLLLLARETTLESSGAVGITEFLA